jgi:prepilin-type N-terminal cleavage/methylation domain-containing protein
MFNTLRQKVSSAFTLSELMVSLAILGVLAALTLPGVFTHMQVSANKARLKTTYIAMNQALNAAVLDGSYTSAIAVLKAKLNYAHLCPANDVTGPCSVEAGGQTAHYTTNLERLIMHDGSILFFHSDAWIGLKVEPNKPTSFQSNFLWLRYNPSNVVWLAGSPQTDGFNTNVKPGELGICACNQPFANSLFTN